MKDSLIINIDGINTRKNMNHSENLNEIMVALLKVQSEPLIAIKDSTNPFHKSTYADLSSVWEACRPVLNKNGLIATQYGSFENSQPVLITMLIHSSGQWIKSILPLNPTKNDPQGIGAAITYMRRYGISGLLGLTTEEDDDGETASGRGKAVEKQKKEGKVVAEPKKMSIDVPKEQIVPKINKTQVQFISNELSKLDNELQKQFFDHIQKNWNAYTINDIPEDKFETAIRVINIFKTRMKEKQKEAVNV